MVCKKCNTQVPYGGTNCPNCGSFIDNSMESVNNNNQFGYTGYNQQVNTDDTMQHETQGDVFGQPSYTTGGPNYNQGYGAPGYGMGNGYGAPGFNAPMQTNAPEFLIFVILGAVSALCCCNFLVAIPGILLAIFMNDAYKRGDMMGYTKLKKITIWVYAIGISLYFVLQLLAIVTGVFGTIIEALEYM